MKSLVCQGLSEDFPEANSRGGMIDPFRIAIAEDVLLDLNERLARSRIPQAIPSLGWDQGTAPDFLERVIEYWRTQYDWRRQEALLNGFGQFMAQCSQQDLHFLHVRSAFSDAKPLLLLHGWPGSIFEFYKIIPLLTEPERFGGKAEDAFHVVAPSLPGFGFSPAPAEPGASPRRMGRWMAELMREQLGYSRYFVQGGDWGSVIGSWLAFDHPGEVAGLHLNMAGLRPHRDQNADSLTEPEQEFLREARRKRSEEFAYQAIQGTRPQTLGYGLNDSPAGLAAWIIEKFRAWSDCGGALENSFTLDEILTNITLYWVTGTITSSMRIYYEFRKGEPGLPPGQRVETPTAFADFPLEILRPPRSWVERAYHVVRWTGMPRGGHFAALEEPELLAGDIQTAFRAMPLQP